MIVRYANEQDEFDPLNGSVVVEAEELVHLMEARRKKRPFVAKLLADNGFMLTFGMGSGVGCVQYSRIDGKPPFLMALSSRPRVKSRHVEFLMANTPTPIPRRNILNFDEVKQIALHFLETGQHNPAFAWEEV